MPGCCAFITSNSPLNTTNCGMTSLTTAYFLLSTAAKRLQFVIFTRTYP